MLPAERTHEVDRCEPPWPLGRSAFNSRPVKVREWFHAGSLSHATCWKKLIAWMENRATCCGMSVTRNERLTVRQRHVGYPASKRLLPESFQNIPYCKQMPAFDGGLIE